MLEQKIERDNKERFITRDTVPIETASSSPFERFDDMVLPGSFATIEHEVEFRRREAKVISVIDDKQGIQLSGINIFNATKELSKAPKNPFLLNNAGKIYLNNGDFDNAIKMFKEAIKYKSDFIIAFLNLASAYEVGEDLESAMDIYTKILAINSSDVRALVNIGNIYLKNKEFDKAKDLFCKVLKIDKENVAALDKLALIYLVEGDSRKAIAYLKKCTLLKSNLPAVYNNLGVAYAVQGVFKKAIEAFKISLKVFPNYRSSIINLSTALKTEGRMSEAIELLEDYSRNIENFEIEELLARLYMKDNKSTKALALLNKILIRARREKLSKQEVGRFLNNIGVIYHKTSDMKNAERCYLESVKEGGYIHSAILANLIDLNLDLRKLDKARYYIEILNRDFKEAKINYYYEGRYNYLESNIKEAVKYLKQSLKKNEKFRPAYVLLSFIFSENFRDYKTAIEISKKAIEHFPSDKIIVNNLAYYYLMNNEVEKAEKILTKIKDVKDKGVYLNATLGLLMIKSDRLEEGCSYYNLAKRISGSGGFGKLIEQKKNLELARYYIDKKDLLKAKDLLNKVVFVKVESNVFSLEAMEMLKFIEDR